MSFYRFKTFKSTYYFPPLTPDSRFIYSLYGDYGGRFAHLLWRLFCHSALVRHLFAIKDAEIKEMPLLRSLLGNDAIFGVNMGTSGPDQKISILGYLPGRPEEGSKKFFAKLSTSERAKVLSRNEIKVYRLLADTGLVPSLYDYQDTDDYVFLKCECICGDHVPVDVDLRQVMPILKKLKEMHYSESSASAIVTDGKDGKPLETCFAHMDFCPWNMLSVRGELRVIDWEMAEEKPLGFDLFTFLLQPSFLLDNTFSGNEVIDRHRSWIDEYFAGEDWQAYLKFFVDYKVAFFSAGQNQILYDRYRAMQQSMQ